MSSPIDGPPPLPTLYEAELNETALWELFTDLEHAAQIHEVRLKNGSLSHSQRGDLVLSKLAALLWSDAPVSVQLVYTHAGRTWVDTLMRQATGVKLIRMQYQKV